ncbi:MAG: hypothetical protein EA411_11750 [Saprospirales bacterium]|nr:MAG: hypothetical protein EA411_11750 [Saprospirales bacterium]
MRIGPFLLGAICILVIGCESENIEEYFADVECPTDNVSFHADVRPILDSHCNDCHNSTAQLGGIILDAYEDVLLYVHNDRLLGSIKHLPGFSPMPQIGSMLDDCSIDQIEAWIQSGAPDN